MKKRYTISAIAIAAVLFAFAPAMKTLTVKPEASNIEWFAKKITGEHVGTVKLQSGSIDLDGDKIRGGQFSIDMTTINCTDLEGEYKRKFEGHLKSDDFFGIGSHKTANFKIKKTSDIQGVKGFNTEIVGDLTIKGITHEVTFPAKVEVKDNKLAAYGEMTIDRTKFDIKYGSSNFFEGLGDKAIMDDFTMKISIGAKM